MSGDGGRFGQSTTTNVASKAEFKSRFATNTIDGLPCRDGFTEDCTLAELKTLRAIESTRRLSA
jgi:glycerophosphoryl diester phosphodiesterase